MNQASVAQNAPQKAVMQDQEAQQWAAQASLRPALRSHVCVTDRDYRGQSWFVLDDRARARHYRFGRNAQSIISRMDGRNTLEDIWDESRRELRGENIERGEVLALVQQLRNNDLLDHESAPDYAALAERHHQHRRQDSKARRRNPLSMRWTLWDPDTMLQRAQPLIDVVFSRPVAMLWLLLVGTAVMLAAVNGAELSRHVFQSALAPHNLMLMWLFFPVLKGIHELSHAAATRRWGGEVHEMGIAMLVLTPVPFVDASAASSFTQRYQRLIVGAAGMMAELAVASLALVLWLLVEPGLVRDACAVVLFIAGLSTVLFNANPLLKFDGYYMLSDWLDMPNLASRSRQYWAYLIQRYVFSVDDAVTPAQDGRERGWLLTYGVGSFVFRLFVAATIILAVAGQYFFVGVLLALWAAYTMLLQPIWRLGRFLLQSPVLASRRSRAVATSSGFVVALLAFVFLLPLPTWTRVNGVVWLPDQAIVRASVDGQFRELLAQPGAQVSAGQPLFRSEDPFLVHEVNIRRAELARLQAELYTASSDDRVRADILREKLPEAEARLAEAEADMEHLVSLSPMDGTFLVPGHTDLPNRFVHQGDTLGYVAAAENTHVRVVVAQNDVALVRESADEIKVRFFSDPSHTVRAKVQREVPAAATRLPSAALGSLGGGEFLVRDSDTSGLEAIEPVFQLELSAVDSAPAAKYGERVQVRFDHGNTTLAQRWFRAGRQLFLRSFGV